MGSQTMKKILLLLIALAIGTIQNTAFAQIKVHGIRLAGSKDFGKTRIKWNSKVSDGQRDYEDRIEYAANCAGLDVVFGSGTIMFTAEYNV